MATVLVSAALGNILWEVENGTLSIFYSGKFGDQESSEVGLRLGFGKYWLGIYISAMPQIAAEVTDFSSHPLQYPPIPALWGAIQTGVLF